MELTKSTTRARKGTDLPVKGGLSVSKGGRSLEDLRRLPSLLTAPDAFVVVGVSSSTGYEWIKRGVIPVVHLGSRMYVQTAQLVEAVFGIAPALLLEDEKHRPNPSSGAGLKEYVGE